MLARTVILTILLCGCGRWTFVEDTTITLKPTLGARAPGTSQLVATTEVLADGKVGITARIETTQCTQLSTSRTQDLHVEKYVSTSKNPHEKLILFGLSGVLGGILVYYLVNGEPTITDAQAQMGVSGWTADQKSTSNTLSAGFISVGALALALGINEARKFHSPRKTVTATHDGAAQPVVVSCPKGPSLDAITIVTPWGDKLETTLRDGKGSLAINWQALAAKATSTNPLTGTWKLISTKPSLETPWLLSADELTMLSRVLGKEQDKVKEDEREKARLSRIEKRKQTGPPSFAVVAATSEYEVVPAGVPTKITVRVQNKGPGPADGPTLTVSAPGMAPQSVQLDPLDVNATSERELSITLPANHPGGEVRLAARFTDPGAPQPIDTTFAMTAAKQLPGTPKLVIEKFEAKGTLRAGTRGELRLIVRNEGTANAFGTTISMTSPKSPALDALKHRIPYVKAGAALEVTIPIDLPREVPDPNPTGLITATVPGGSARCGGAIADCYAKLTIVGPPVPVLLASCEIVRGATAKDKRLIANAGSVLEIHCKLDNKGEEAAAIAITAGIDKASAPQPKVDLAPAASTTTIFQLPVPRESVAASNHEVVISLTAPHAVGIERRLTFTIGRVALCAPNSLDRTEYNRKTTELNRSKNAGEITQKDYDDADKELLGCLKR